MEQELVYNMGISSPSYFRTPSPPHPTAHTKLSITRRHPIHDHISTLRCRRARRRRGRTILVARSGGGEGAAGGVAGGAFSALARTRARFRRRTAQERILRNLGSDKLFDLGHARV